MAPSENILKEKKLNLSYVDYASKMETKYSGFPKKSTLLYDM